MGISGSNTQDQEIKKDVAIKTHAAPMSKKEMEDLYSYESAVCKINFKIKNEGQILNCFGTGFFLK